MKKWFPCRSPDKVCFKMHYSPNSSDVGKGRTTRLMYANITKRASSKSLWRTSHIIKHQNSTAVPETTKPRFNIIRRYGRLSVKCPVGRRWISCVPYNQDFDC